MVRYLNACGLDVDVGRDPSEAKSPVEMMTTGTAMGRIADLQLQNRIPPVSVLCQSGRGLYCFWLLVDEDGRLSIRSHDHLIQDRGLWTRLQRELASRLRAAGLPVCPTSVTDPTHYYRISGSINPKSETRALWYLVGDASGPFTYRLQDLAAMLDVPAICPAPVPAVTTTQGTVDSERSQRCKKSAGTRARRILGELAVFEQYRGGFRHGHRRLAISYRAMLMVSLGSTPAEVEAAAIQTLNACQPATRDNSDVDPVRIAKQAAARQLGLRVSPGWMAEQLGVTDEEAGDLDLQYLVPRRLAAERKAAKAARITIKAKVLRREAVLAVLSEWKQIHPGTRPSVDEVVEMLAKRGDPHSRASVYRAMRELEAMGLLGQLPRHGPGWRRGRPRNRSTFRP